jgi:hypothetical protein
MSKGKLTDEATAYGLTKQRVNGIINRVMAVANDVPPGWEHMEIWLPPELTMKVRKMADEAKAKITGGLT